MKVPTLLSAWMFLLLAMLGSLSACGDRGAVTGLPSPPMRRLVADEDCTSQLQQRIPQCMLPYLVQESGGFVWRNYSISSLCSTIGCSTACWSLLNNCGAVSTSGDDGCFLGECGGGGNGQGDGLDDETLDGPDPTPTDDPDDSAAWSGWAHHKLIELALGDKCAAARGALDEASLQTDATSGWRDDQASVLTHGMWPWQSIPDSSQVPRMIDSVIEAHLSASEAFARQDRWASAMFELGVAFHTITDRMSPAHVDANGVPRKWPIPAGAPNQHTKLWGGIEGWSDATSSVKAQLSSEMQAVWNRVAAAGNASGHPVPNCRSPRWSYR